MYKLWGCTSFERSLTISFLRNVDVIIDLKLIRTHHKECLKSIVDGKNWAGKLVTRLEPRVLPVLPVPIVCHRDLLLQYLVLWFSGVYMHQVIDLSSYWFAYSRCPILWVNSLALKCSIVFRGENYVCLESCCELLLRSLVCLSRVLQNFDYIFRVLPAYKRNWSPLLEWYKDQPWTFPQ